jgi:hypothetical protein
VTEDMDMVLIEDILQILDMEDTMEEEVCHLSLSIISGGDANGSMRVRARSRKQLMLILVDSGSSATFISSVMVKKLGLVPTNCKPVKVKVVNGEMLISDSYVPHVEWSANEHLYKIDMRVLDLDVFDAILGYDWLRVHSPMTCDWEKKILQFQDHWVQIKLCGDGVVIQTKVEQVIVAQVQKWLKGNKVWSFALLEEAVTKKPEVNAQLVALLKKFHDVFSPPV